MENKDIEMKNLETTLQDDVKKESLIKQILKGFKFFNKKNVVKGITTALTVSLISTMIASCDINSDGPSMGQEGKSTTPSSYSSYNTDPTIPSDSGDDTEPIITEIKMVSEEGKEIENSAEYIDMLQAYKEVEMEYLNQGYAEVPSRGTDRHPTASNYYKDKWNLSEEDIKNNTNIIQECYSDDSVYVLTMVTPDTIKYPDSEVPFSTNPYKTTALYSLLRYDNVNGQEIDDLISLGNASVTGKQMAENAVKHDILLNKILAKYDYEVLTENFGRTGYLSPSDIGKDFDTKAFFTIPGYEDGKIIAYSVFKTNTDELVLFKCNRELDLISKSNLDTFDWPHYKIPVFNAIAPIMNYKDVHEIDNIIFGVSIDITMHFDNNVSEVLPSTTTSD